MCRRCKNARDLFNKILTNFGFPNWPKIYDMHFLVSGSRRGYLAIGNRSWNINEESFVSWFIQFAASWLLVYEGGSRFAIVEILRLDGTWDMRARAEVGPPAPGALGAALQQENCRPTGITGIVRVSVSIIYMRSVPAHSICKGLLKNSRWNFYKLDPDICDVHRAVQRLKVHGTGFDFQYSWDELITLSLNLSTPKCQISKLDLDNHYNNTKKIAICNCATVFIFTCILFCSIWSFYVMVQVDYRIHWILDIHHN